MVELSVIGVTFSDTVATRSASDSGTPTTRPRSSDGALSPWNYRTPCFTDRASDSGTFQMPCGAAGGALPRRKRAARRPRAVTTNVCALRDVASGRCGVGWVASEP